MYYVYVLLSKKHNKTYTGIAYDLGRRLRQHNRGLNTFTKRYRPWKIIYTDKYRDRLEARKREKYLKSTAGRRWIKKNLFG
ncbi:GIY-YIG nuclease family protein [Patescibacteria group bacterium]|nr:GIY-YIG nuclease family protein [Patescibacteria group bacterium]